VESQAEDLSNEIANTSESNLCFSEKSECMLLREENEKLKIEIESLKEINRILEEERNKLESIKSNDQPSNPISREAGWQTNIKTKSISSSKVSETRRQSAGSEELRNRFEALDCDMEEVGGNHQGKKREAGVG